MLNFRSSPITHRLTHVFAFVFLLSTGCWSEVEYEPHEKPSAEQAVVPTPPEQEAPAPLEEASTTVEEKSEAEATEEPPAAESAATPAETVATPEATPPPTDAVAPSNEENKLTYDELFGEPAAPPAESPATEAPPLADSEPAPPAEPSPPASEIPTETLLPHERPATPPAPTPGDRYETLPTTEPPDEAPLPMPPAVDDRYATTPEPLKPTVELLPAEDQFVLPESASPPPSESTTPDRYANSTPAESVPMTPSESNTPPIAAETPTASPLSSPNVSFEGHPAATPASASMPANTRLQSWLLGSKWSLILLKEHTVGLEDEDSRLSKECEELATMLKVKLPQSQFSSASKPTAAFLENLLFAARELGSSIGKEDGADEMALFEVAVKSNLLLVAAEPRPDLVLIIVRSVSAAAKRAKLPDELIQQFTDSLANTPKPHQFDGAIQEFHRGVESYLRTLP